MKRHWRLCVGRGIHRTGLAACRKLLWSTAAVPCPQMLRDAAYALHVAPGGEENLHVL